MNSSPDVTGFIQQLFFQQNDQAGHYSDALARLSAVLHYCLSSSVLTVLGCLLLLGLTLLVYRPRLTRGSFWLPAFGFFGGTPTLYLHTRPASVCGLFTSTRPLKRSAAQRALHKSAAARD